MSNFLALATVTSVLREIVQEAVAVVPGAGVRVGRPSNENDFIGVCMYLYQVTPNAALRNNDLPTRNDAGVFVERPQAALDLSYLFAFYSEKDLASERMLGSVVSAFNAFPILTSEQIGRAIRENDFLTGSNLAEQPEKVKLSPVFMNLEELSKLWTVFFQVAHRVSLTYQASVVLVDADETPQKAIPALGADSTVDPNLPLPIDS